MGVARLPEIAEALIAAGRPGSEPAAVVEAGTLPGQRSVRAPLGELAQAVAEAGVRPPSVTIVGAVAELADRLAWLQPRPLAGVTVAITRARAQASVLARRLAELGARVVQAPTIRVRPLADAASELDPSGYDLVCLTSPNGVQELFARLAAGGRDARSLAGAKVAAIGPGTAEALLEHGVRADIVPDRFVAEALVEALAEVPVRRALIARAREARELLPQALRERGAQVDVLALYETVPEPLSERTLRQAREADYITFTSASTVRFFLQAAGGEAGLSPGTRIVSIGPVTSASLLEHGLHPDVEAERHDITGVLEAILSDHARRAGAGAQR
jgi:uroporphyrinogen III methyltransferase/synthase